MIRDQPDEPRTHPFVIAGVILDAVAWSLPGIPVVLDGVYLNLIGAVFCGSLAAMLSLLVLLKERSGSASKAIAWVVLLFSSPFSCCFAIGGVTNFIMVCG